MQTTRKTHFHLPTKSMNHVLKILDLSFGTLSVLYLIIFFVAWSFGELDGVRGLILFTIFLVTNLIISQFSIRTKSPAKYETLRYVFDIVVFCPLSLLWIKGTMEPAGTFWFPYFILAMGSSNITFQLSGKSTWAIYINILVTLSYLVVALWFMENPNWIQVSTNLATMLMFSFLFVKILGLANKSYTSEIEKSKKLEEALLELEKTQELVIHQSKMSALGEMAGGIAHEINNPLEIISSSVQLLKKAHQKGRLTDEVLLNTIANIEETVKRVTKIIKGLRIVSRESEGGAFSPIVIRELIEDVMGLCSEKFKENGVKFEADLNSPIYSSVVVGDRVQLSQVLLNLLGNAYDAVENLDEKWIKIEISEEPEYWILKVIDSGPGVPQLLQGKIFDPFFTSKEIGKGTGLGLSISKNLVRNNGGDLTLNTQEPHTCFEFKLPKSQ